MSAWRCHPAPGPEEVVWGNVGWRMWERRGRRLLMWAAFVALALFYMIPIAAVQSLLALNSLTAWFQSVPVLNALVTAVLPGLVLKLFLKLLPWLLGLMMRFAGSVSESAVDLGVVSRYFIFQVVTVFFGSFVAGSFANQIKQFAEAPGSIVTVLGTAAPQTAIFFTTYLMLQALLAKPLSLLRLPGLVIFWVRSRLAATERAKARVWQSQEQTYGGQIPDDTIALLLGLVFCLICPLIVPMALIYFAVVYVVMKYQLLYVKGHKYQSGGQAWMRVFGQVCFALGLFQLTMIGILGIKRSVGAPLMVLPLLPVTVGFWIWCRALFWRPQQTLALEDAARQDAADQQQQERGTQQGGRTPAAGPARAAGADPSQLYLSPSFRLDLGPGFEALLYEADAMLAFLNNDGQGSDELEAAQARLTANAEGAYFTAEEEALAAAEASWLDMSVGGGQEQEQQAGGTSGRGGGAPSATAGAGAVVMTHNPIAAGDHSSDDAGGGSADAAGVPGGSSGGSGGRSFSAVVPVSVAAARPEAAWVAPPGVARRAGSISIDVELGLNPQ